MRKKVAESKKNRIVRWPLFYVVLFLVTVILIAATVLWIESTQAASERTINTLGEFYLEEITERNVGSITSELEKKTRQMERTLTVLDENHLQSEEAVRQFIHMVQQINGLDMFALVDKDGMVYTADSTFSGISRFGFLSEKITETEIHMVKSYGTRTMIIIATPVSYESGDGIPVVSCFTGLNIESIISTDQLQSAENKTYCSLFTQNGENLLSQQGEYKNGKSLFDILEESADFAAGYSLEKLKDDWKNGREGYTVYYRESTGNTYVYYKTVPGTDMIITSLMRESNINEVVEVGTQKMLRSSMIYLIIVVVFLFLLFLMIIRVIQDIKKSQQENEQFKIAGALSNDYSDIFLMEPLQDTTSTMKVKGQMIDARKREVRSYRGTWKEYVERFVVAEDRKKVLSTVKAEHLCAILKDIPEYTLDFRAELDDGIRYFQVKFVKIAGDENRLIVGFRNIDIQMHAELERQKVLQDALASAQHANRAKTTFLNI